MIEERPKVSVIIPNYNHSEFLNKRIDSVLNQTYSNIEVIILDDFSLDNSKDIIETYRYNSKVSHIIYNDFNTGSPFVQWRKGIELATGELIWIAESDDWAAPEFLENLVPVFHEFPSVGLVYCDSYAIQKYDSQKILFSNLKNKYFHVDRWNYNYFEKGISEIRNYLLMYCTINNTSAALFKKDILCEANVFDQKLRLTGDFYTFLKVCYRSDIYYVSKPLNYYYDPFKEIRNYEEYILESLDINLWIYKNQILEDKRASTVYFLERTRNSLIKDWSIRKVKAYYKILQNAPYLFIRFLIFNAIEPIKERVKRASLISSIIF